MIHLPSPHSPGKPNKMKQNENEYPPTTHLFSSPGGSSFSHLLIHIALIAVGGGKQENVSVGSIE